MRKLKASVAKQDSTYKDYSQHDSASFFNAMVASCSPESALGKIYNEEISFEEQTTITCKKCGDSDVHSQKKASLVVDIPQAGWLCKLCTYFNSARTSGCEMCGAKKLPLPKDMKEWSSTSIQTFLHEINLSQYMEHLQSSGIRTGTELLEIDSQEELEELKIASPDAANLLKYLQQAQKGQSRTQRAQSHMTLDCCVKHTLRKEQWDSEKNWECDRCNSTDAEFSISMAACPNYLCVKLNRGSEERKDHRRIDFKLTGWEFPKDCLPKGAGSFTYDLYAVANHSGGVQGGHYWAYKKGAGNKWYQMNDSHVSPMDQRKVVSSECMMICYKRREFVC